MSAVKSQNKNKKVKTLSPLHCPGGMTLEQWQRGLRRQAALREGLTVMAPRSHGDPFIVSNPKSGRSYAVDYYGETSPLNRCECMDFKTSGLGVCKHIEAITQEARGKYRRRTYTAPEHSYVFTDYPEGRRIKIHIGTVEPTAMRMLAQQLFDSDNELADMGCDPSDFIRKAKTLDPGFVWESDAMELLIEARDRRRREKIIKDKYAESYFDGLLKTGLHPYQADGVRFAFIGGRTINADEMGLGKTVQAIATAELLRRECGIESVVIICPTSLKYQWLAEIRKFTDSTAIVVEGNALKRKEQLCDTTHFYKICSFHALSNSIKGGFIPQADMIIYDELQRLKNRETQIGKQLRLLHSQYVMALSGTPLENKLDELYSVTQLVDQYVLGPYYRFTADTTVTDDTGKVTGYHNLHAVAERLKDTLIRRKKKDVRLQMPARTDTNLYVPMTKEQQAIHDEYKFNVGIIIDKWHRHRFLSEADRKRLLLYLSMMRMVCDSTFILDQKSRHDTKIEEIMAIITNMIETGSTKVVVFSQWERMLRILSMELENAGINFCFLHGGVPSAKRKALIDNFRDDPDCRVFLSTDAGATGLNLQSASLLVNLDLPWNPAVLEQRIARIYRLGQENPVQIINMVARATIEERMLTKLKFKSDLAAGILGGGDDAVFIEGSKFARIIDVVDDVMSGKEDVMSGKEEEAEEEGGDTKAETGNDTGPARERAGEEDIPALSDDSRETPEAAPQGETRHREKRAAESASGAEAPSETHHRDGQTATGDAGAESPAQTRPTGGIRRTPVEVREIVSGGLSALSRIAEVLREPEGAASLADALVREDPATGQASINIPVADKTTVVNILSAFSALLNRQ